MTYPPKNTITVIDGQINLPLGLESYPLVVGATSSGTANTLYYFSDTTTLVATLGRGPAVEMAAGVIVSAGGVFVLKTATSTAGSIGTVAVSRVGSSTGTLAVAGTPSDAFRLRTRITAAGTLGAARFQYALDGDSATTADGWSPNYTIPSGGTFAIPGTGLTLTWTAGAGPTYFEVGDIFGADCVAAHYTTTDLTAAFTTNNNFLAQLGSRRVRRIGFAGVSATASAAATLAAFIAGILDDLTTRNRYCRAVMDGGSMDTITAFRTAFASFTDDRIGIVYDPITTTAGCKIVSKVPFTGWAAPVVPAVNAVFERFAATGLSESCARVMTGALRGVTRIGNDEGLNPLFSSEDRIITLRRVDDRAGFFITKPWIRSAPTSTFRTLQWGTVLDEMCEVIHATNLQWLESNMDSVTDGTGRLAEYDAKRVEAAANLALKEKLKEPTDAEGRKGHVVDCSYTVTRTNNYLATGEIYGFAGAIPKRETEGINTTVALVSSLNTAAA